MVIQQQSPAIERIENKSFYLMKTCALKRWLYIIIINSVRFHWWKLILRCTKPIHCFSKRVFINRWGWCSSVINRRPPSSVIIITTGGARYWVCCLLIPRVVRGEERRTTRVYLSTFLTQLLSGSLGTISSDGSTPSRLHGRLRCDRRCWSSLGSFKSCRTYRARFRLLRRRVESSGLWKTQTRFVFCFYIYDSLIRSLLCFFCLSKCNSYAKYDSASVEKSTVILLRFTNSTLFLNQITLYQYTIYHVILVAFSFPENY